MTNVSALSTDFIIEVKDTSLEHGDLLNLSMQPQPLTKWCWVEVAASVKEFYDGAKVSRCVLAKGALKKILGMELDCCGNMGECNREVAMDKALLFAGNLDATSSIDAPVGQDDLKSVIPKDGTGKGKPIVCVLDDREKGGHAAVIIGWYVKKELWVKLADPLNGGSKSPVAKTYEELTDSVGFEWKQTLFTEG